MGERDSSDAGFSLVEVIIAMVLFGLVAVAIIPVLWQGVMYSSQQSAVATATRQLYALVESARETPSCASLAAAAAAHTFSDGANRAFSTSGTAGSCFSCPSATGIAVPLSLTATQDSRVLAEVSALVFVPAAKTSVACP
ncbi:MULTISPECIES: type II secretion system protein [unclassified Microbacterium]|uniref:type II secretion system protein n=1 Tax=unclassified Microbacterium TaxID=2609290 RepID=UPI003010390B